MTIFFDCFIGFIQSFAISPCYFLIIYFALVQEERKRAGDFLSSPDAIFSKQIKKTILTFIKKNGSPEVPFAFFLSFPSIPPSLPPPFPLRTKGSNQETPRRLRRVQPDDQPSQQMAPRRHRAVLHRARPRLSRHESDRSSHAEAPCDVASSECTVWAFGVPSCADACRTALRAHVCGRGRVRPAVGGRRRAAQHMEDTLRPARRKIQQ